MQDMSKSLFLCFVREGGRGRRRGGRGGGWGRGGGRVRGGGRGRDGGAEGHGGGVVGRVLGVPLVLHVGHVSHGVVGLVLDLGWGRGVAFGGSLGPFGVDSLGSQQDG